jgi:membrane protease YdiL (CAAX protease family)
VDYLAHTRRQPEFHPLAPTRAMCIPPSIRARLIPSAGYYSRLSRAVRTMLTIEPASPPGFAAARVRSPAVFFLLVFALSAPLWLVPSLAQYQPLPSLPLSAVMVLCPLVASLILIAFERGSAGVTSHLKRALDFRLIERKVWYAPILLLMPATAIVAYISMRMLDVPLPVPALSVSIVPALFLLFFLAALAEELGWSGYVLDPLQSRWGALLASLIVGLVWAVWHVGASVAGRPHTRLDRVVVDSHRGYTRSAHLAVQQHWQKRVRRRTVPCDDEGAANARAIWEALTLCTHD